MTTQAHCGSCRQPIRWVTTEGGKNMPLDWEATDTGNVVPRLIDGKGVRAHILRDDETPGPQEPRYTTHWETCPDAKKYRKGNK